MLARYLRKVASHPRLAALGLSVALLTPAATAQTTLSVGDLQILGVTSDTSDSFAFVLWKDVDASTVIRFMDHSFTNATVGVNGTEGDMSLTFTSAVGTGTVIRVVDTGATLANGGTFLGTKMGSLSGISVDGDQLFAYQGTAVGSGTSFSGRTLLYGINVANTSWLTSGTASSNSSYLPTAISGLDANGDSGAFDNVDYIGARSGLTTAIYRAALSNVTSPNYSGSDTRFDLGTGGFTSTTSANLIWDNNGGTAGTGGTGTWDTTTTNKWTNVTSDTFFRWVNSSVGNQHTAVFAGTAGAVTVASGGVTASSLQFDVDGYTLQGDTITLSNTTSPIVTVPASGHTATITSPLAGTNGLSKTGPGTVIFTGNNSLTGAISITDGTLIASGTGGNQALGGASDVSVSGGTLLLGANDQINDSADLTLAGGSFSLGGFSEGGASGAGLGELILNATSTLDFGLAGSGTSVVRFSGLGSHTGSLQITNFDPATERLLFSGLSGDFDFAQDDVSFNGTPGFATVQFSGYFEIVAVPEPATVFGGLALIGLVIYRERRRLRSLCGLPVPTGAKG